MLSLHVRCIYKLESLRDRGHHDTVLLLFYKGPLLVSAQGDDEVMGESVGVGGGAEEAEDEDDMEVEDEEEDEPVRVPDIVSILLI